MILPHEPCVTTQLGAQRNCNPLRGNSLARVSIANILGDPFVHFLDGSLFQFSPAEDCSANVF